MFGLLNRKLSRQWSSRSSTRQLSVDGSSIASDDGKEWGSIPGSPVIPHSNPLSTTSVDDPRNLASAMSISTTCRKVMINEGILSAECLKADNVTYVMSSISLDAFLGNVDGKFIQGGRNFSQSAQDVGIIGGVMYATLQAFGDQYVHAKFDLQQLIVNNDGVLTATIPESLDIGKATAPESTKTVSTTSSTPAESGFSAASTTSSLPTSAPQSSSNLNNNHVIAPVVLGSLDTAKATSLLEKTLSTSPASAASAANGFSATSTTPSLATSIPSQSSSSLNDNRVITPVVPASLDSAKTTAIVLENNISTAGSASAASAASAPSSTSTVPSLPTSISQSSNSLNNNRVITPVVPRSLDTAAPGSTKTLPTVSSASAAGGFSAASTTPSLPKSISSQSSSSFNNNRVITAVVPGSLDTAKATASALEKNLSATSSPSAASATSGFSATSTTSSLATSMSSHSSSSSIQKSSSTFHSSAFRNESQQYSIEDSGSNFLLEDGFFHLDFIRSDGSVSHTSIDLDLYIGIVNGQLQWGATGFSRACQSFYLDGFFLVVQIPVPATNNTYKLELLTSRLDLRTHFRISGSGILIYLETNKKLSMMLSEVPWMKFKVIAEPDLSVFASHPVIKHTLARIAESTVEHFTINMHRMLTIAMQEAIVAITTSVMKHVSMEIERSVRDAVGHAGAGLSVTEAEYLHIAQGFYAGGGYGGRGYAAGGYATGGGYGAGGYTAGRGYQAGGYVGGANGTNGTVQVGTGGGGAASAQSTLVSSESVGASQSASRSESYSSETSTAVSASTAQAETEPISVHI